MCKLCRKEYKNTGNTTNFKSHIDGEHKITEIHLQGQPDTQPSASNPPSRPTLTQTTLKDFNNNEQGKLANLGPERKKRIYEVLLKLIVGKALPPSLVDNQFFKDFVAALEPRYKIPSRKAIMKSLASKQEEMEQKIQTEQTSVEGVGITHDGWTSNATESYDTTTVHYIRDWQLKSAILGTKRMEVSHTAEKIAESLLVTKAKWKLPDHCVATTDNAANEKKAFELLKWQRFGCYGHRINLVVKNALCIPKCQKC